MQGNRSLGDVSVSTVAELIELLRQLPGEAGVSNVYGEDLLICPIAATVESKISVVEFK